MRDVSLPEFDKNRRISQQRALIFDNPTCKYDIILGTNFLSKAGIKLDYENGNIEWYDSTLPMRPSYGLTSEDFDAMEDQYFIQLEDKIFGEDWLDCYATVILDARYEKVNVDDGDLDGDGGDLRWRVSNGAAYGAASGASCFD